MMSNSPPAVRDLQLIRRLPGSHRPWLCTDGFYQYVLKLFSSRHQAEEEVLADRLYAAAAVPVPESWVLDCPSGWSRLSRWIDGRPLGLVMKQFHYIPHMQDIHGGLALDIILQNDDVLGRHGDNIIIGHCPGDPNFRAAWRVDNGSALRWSATEGPRYDFGLAPDLRWLDSAWPSLIFDASANRSNPPERRRHIGQSLARLDHHWPAVLAAAPQDLRPTLDARYAWLHRHVAAL